MSGSRKRRHSARLEAKQKTTDSTTNRDNQGYHSDDNANISSTNNIQSREIKPKYSIKLMQNFGAIYRPSEPNKYKFSYTRENKVVSSLDSGFKQWVDYVGNKASGLIPGASQFDALKEKVTSDNGLQWASHALETFKKELPTLVTNHIKPNETEDDSEPPKKRRRKLSTRSPSKRSPSQSPIINITNNNNSNSNVISTENDIILDNKNETPNFSNNSHKLNSHSLTGILSSHLNQFKEDLLSNLSSKFESRSNHVHPATNEQMQQQLMQREKELIEKEKKLIEKEKQLIELEKESIEKDKLLMAKDKEIKQKDGHIRVLRSRRKQARAELKEWKVSTRKLFKRMTKQGKRKRAKRINEVANKATDNDEASREEANDIIMNANKKYKNKYKSKLYRSWILRHNNLVNADAKNIVRRLANGALSVMYTVSRAASESFSKINNRAFDIKREEEGLFLFCFVFYLHLCFCFCFFFLHACVYVCFLCTRFFYNILALHLSFFCNFVRVWMCVVYQI